jgi:hypothetical protein
MNIGLVGSHKTVAEIEAAGRIPFQVLQPHRQLPFTRDRQRMSQDPRWRRALLPYSTLPIFFTAAIRRALSSATNFENSGASR